ncbi:diacylglycerol kinase [Synechococcus sp. PCC 7502]|uniref:diacylglycerol kinase n=1 Tax=Synechococcus sp. PCC 7502 TaxID=1173263 RepID=UPI00029FAE9B|nr:diacylglycerol kinase [Synechococcus sp. PCC 7502]AFY74695.1 diacylglycerol kinase [Synechococcus sp. PCC 7502]
MNKSQYHERTSLNIGTISTELKNVLEQPERNHSLQVSTSLWASFNFAWQGLSYAFKSQRNFRIHTIIGSIALLLSLCLQLPAINLAVISLTIGAVLGMELINTALESVVDLTLGQKYDPLAKIAKDCAAGAVLVASIVALGVALVLLVPPLVGLIIGLGNSLDFV